MSTMTDRATYRVVLNGESKAKNVPLSPTAGATHQALLTGQYGLQIVFPSLTLPCCRTMVKSFKDKDGADYGLGDVAEAQEYFLDLELVGDFSQEAHPLYEVITWNSDQVVARMYEQSEKRTYGFSEMNVGAENSISDVRRSFGERDDAEDPRHTFASTVIMEETNSESPQSLENSGYLASRMVRDAMLNLDTMASQLPSDIHAHSLHFEDDFRPPQSHTEVTECEPSAESARHAVSLHINEATASANARISLQPNIANRIYHIENMTVVTQPPNSMNTQTGRVMRPPESSQEQCETVEPESEADDLEGFGTKLYENSTLKATDRLIYVVADCGRHSYQKFSFELKVPLKDVDDLRTPAEGVNKHKLLFIIKKWMEHGRVTRGQLLEACRRADVYGAVDLEVEKIQKS